MEKHSPQTECEPLQRASTMAWKSGVVSFYGLGNFIVYYVGGLFQQF